MASSTSSEEPAAKRLKLSTPSLQQQQQQQQQQLSFVIIHLQGDQDVKISKSHSLFSRSRQLSNLINSPSISSTDNQIYLETVPLDLFELVIQWCESITTPEPNELTPDIAKVALTVSEKTFVERLDWKTMGAPLSYLAWQLELLSLVVVLGKRFAMLVESTKTDSELYALLQVQPDFSPAPSKLVAVEKQHLLA
jgi:hypothetical protein